MDDDPLYNIFGIFGVETARLVSPPIFQKAFATCLLVSLEGLLDHKCTFGNAIIYCSIASCIGQLYMTQG